ncbi:MAG: TMEM175 family protein [Acidimicrobiales bacterium]|jgi:uncharacterized membrane protein
MAEDDLDGYDSPSAGIALDPRRLEAFSDGVMAVIITIMAFQLKTPVTANWHGLSGRVPSLLVYILSFTVIGIYWNNHHHLLRSTKHINAAVMWSNLVLLFWLSLVPFATAWEGSNHTRALPAATYGVVALGSALAYFALMRSILRANAEDDAIRTAIGKNTKGMISPVIYVIGVALAFVTPYLAYGCYAAVSLMWIIPDRRLAKKS